MLSSLLQKSLYSSCSCNALKRVLMQRLSAEGMTNVTSKPVALQPSRSIGYLTQPWLTHTPALHSACTLSCRYKHRKRPPPKKNIYDSESDDSDNEEEVTLENGPGFKDVQATIPSMRLSAIAKLGFNMSTSQSEKEFYNKKFRVNGKKAAKKSQTLKVGDILDHIKEGNTTGQDLVEISRVELRHIGGLHDTSNTKYNVIVRRFPKMFLKEEELE